MKSAKRAIEAATVQLAQGFKYPPELLAKHDASKKLDREYLAYLTEGGPSGAYYQWLTLVAKNADARMIIELGNRFGTSTIALYAGMKPSQILYSVDVSEDQRFVPDCILRDSRVKFLIGNSLDLSLYGEHGADIPLNIDILWIDTAHYYEQVSAEFAVFEPLLADEAIVVLDDINLNDMRRFFDEVPYEKFDLTASCHKSGFGAFVYMRERSQGEQSPNERLVHSLLRSSRFIFERYGKASAGQGAAGNGKRRRSLFRLFR